jgi:hypothetical protein
VCGILPRSCVHWWAGMIRCRSQIKLYHTSWSRQASCRQGCWILFWASGNCSLARRTYAAKAKQPACGYARRFIRALSFPLPGLAWGLGCLQMESLSFLYRSQAGASPLICSGMLACWHVVVPLSAKQEGTFYQKKSKEEPVAAAASLLLLPGKLRESIHRPIDARPACLGLMSPSNF